MIIIITSADTDLLAISKLVLPEDFPKVKAFNSDEIQRSEEKLKEVLEMVEKSNVVILRLLGGKDALGKGFDEIVKICKSKGIPLIACPAYPEWSEDLLKACSVPKEDVDLVFSYLIQGGLENFKNLLLFLCNRYLGKNYSYQMPINLPWEGLYKPSKELSKDSPTIGILFYRAYWVSGDLDFIDALIKKLEELGAKVLPVFSFSLRYELEEKKDLPKALYFFLDNEGKVDCIINTMSFSVNPDFWLRLNVPVIQGIVSLAEEEEWERSHLGLGPIDSTINVILPEFDGKIITVPFSFKKRVREITLHKARDDRVEFLARLSLRLANLRRKKNSEKKIAIILSNYPSKYSRIGNAVGLDTPNSVINILKALREAGYYVSDIPKDGNELIIKIIESKFSLRGYKDWFSNLPEKVKEELIKNWGEPEDFEMKGLLLGNVFIGLQPERGFGDNPMSIYHNPDLVPPHQYLAYYYWIREIFKADAIIHVGKHGTLEWLPGKGVGLSKYCYPEVVLGDLPLFYPFIINNPGEGAQAKRRSHAVIIDHLIPPLTTADSYGNLLRLEQLMDEYSQAQIMDPSRLPIIEEEIWKLVQEAKLDRDLKVDKPPDDFSKFLQKLDGYICEIKDSQIRGGLHILGELPKGDELIDLLSSITRLDNGDIPSLRRALAEALGLNYKELLEDRGKIIKDLPLKASSKIFTAGDVIEEIEKLSRKLYKELLSRGSKDIPALIEEVIGKRDIKVERVLKFVADTVYPNLLKTEDEIKNLLKGLEGQYVPPGPAGAPSRGMAHVLPTGRNFYALDPRAVPSPSAWEVGKRLAEELLKKYLKEEGKYPETVGIIVWGTSTIRTQGEDIAEILYLLGVKPVWQEESRMVIGLEVIPLEELGRPRIDVLVRISGFFRDSFLNLIDLLSDAINLVANLKEDPERNFVRKHLLEEMSKNPYSESMLYRIFGDKPGSYGVGLLDLINAKTWEKDEDLAKVYINWSGYAYSRGKYGVDAKDVFKLRLSQVMVAVKNQDNREHDIFDSDDYFQEHGGMIASIRAITGKNPKKLFGDTSDPENPKVRDLEEEAKRVFRARVINPKWINAMKKHGYKGAFELASTVDFIFGYDATAQIMEDWMYNELAEKYALELKEFFKENNPWALKDILERLMEAHERGLWKNPKDEILKKLKETYLELESYLE